MNIPRCDLSDDTKLTVELLDQHFPGAIDSIIESEMERLQLLYKDVDDLFDPMQDKDDRAHFVKHKTLLSLYRGVLTMESRRIATDPAVWLGKEEGWTDWDSFMADHPEFE